MNSNDKHRRIASAEANVPTARCVDCWWWVTSKLFFR